MKEIEIAGRVGKNRKQKDGLPFEGRSSFYFLLVMVVMIYDTVFYDISYAIKFFVPLCEAA